MADIEIRAQAFWADTEGTETAVGFAESEDTDDGYVLFEGVPGDAAGLYVEISDEIFGAKDALERVVFSDAGFLLTVKADMMAKLGMVRDVQVFIDAGDADGQAALAALKGLLAAALIG